MLINKFGRTKNYELIYFQILPQHLPVETDLNCIYLFAVYIMTLGLYVPSVELQDNYNNHKLGRIRKESAMT